MYINTLKSDINLYFNSPFDLKKSVQQEMQQLASLIQYVWSVSRKPAKLMDVFPCPLHTFAHICTSHSLKFPMHVIMYMLN